MEIISPQNLCFQEHDILIVMFAECPISWGSRLQTEIPLSTAESEYIALSTAMREVFSFMD